MSDLRRSSITSYWIGASNQLFRQEDQVEHDLIVIDREDDQEDSLFLFLFLSPTLKSQLQLTIADRRFTQLFQDPLTSLSLSLFPLSPFPSLIHLI